MPTDQMAGDAQVLLVYTKAGQPHCQPNRQPNLAVAQDSRADHSAVRSRLDGILTRLEAQARHGTARCIALSQWRQAAALSASTSMYALHGRQHSSCRTELSVRQ